MSAIGRVGKAWRALFGYPEPSGKGVVPDYRASILDKRYELPPVSLDHAKAVRFVATVRACVLQRSEDLATLPVFIEREKGKDWQPIERKPQNIVDVWHAGNPRQTGIEVKRDYHANFMTHGNAYMVAEDFGMKRVSELWVMPSHLVTLEPSERRMPRVFLFDRGGRTEAIPAKNVIPWHDFQPEDEPIGVSALDSVQLQYETRYDLMRMFQKVVRRGGIAPGYFRVPQPANGIPVILKDEEKEAIARQLRIVRSKADTDIILDMLEFDRMGLTMQELQFFENTNLTDADICRVMGVPPWLIGIKEGAKLGDSGQSASADERIYWMGNRKRAEMFDALMTERLVPMFREEGVRFRTDFSAVPSLNAPLLNSAQQAVALAGRPVLTVNEVRRMNGLPPANDPSADELYEAPVPEPFGSAPGDKPPGGDAPAKDNTKPAAEKEKSRAMDDPDRVERWRGKDALMKRYERKFERAYVALIEDRKKQILGKLETSGIRAMHAKRVLDLEEVFSPDPDEEAKIQEIYESLIAERGREAAKEIALELEVNLRSQQVSRFIEARKSLGLDGAMNTLMQDVRMSLAEGVGLGESLTELATRVSSYLDEAEQGRVLTIARTESVSAFNFATAEAWRQSGEVEAMEWLTARDSVVRDSHAEADGQVANMANGFRVGGSVLEFPGDPSGPPEETINCRCTLLPVISERARRARPLSRYFPSRNGHTKPSRVKVTA
jgi:HK97 family phage portal protein